MFVRVGADDARVPIFTVIHPISGGASLERRAQVAERLFEKVDIHPIYGRRWQKRFLAYYVQKAPARRLETA